MSTRSKHKAANKPRTRAETKEETRKALIEAGIEAFAEEGLDGPSLDSICERAGKTRGAFYVHFQDRDELLAAVMDHVLGSFARAVIGADGAGDLERTVRAFVELAKAPRGLPGSRVPMHQFLAACARDERVRARYQQFLAMATARLSEVARQAQNEGTLRDDVAAESIGALLITLVNGLYMLREQRVPMSLDALSSDLLQLLAPARRS